MTFITSMDLIDASLTRSGQLLSEAEANKAEISEKLKIYKSVSSSAETKRGHLAAVADMQFKTQQMKKLKSLTKLDLLNVYEKFYSVVKQELVSRNFEQDLPDLFATLMGIFISNNVKSSLTLDFVQSTDSNPQPTVSTCIFLLISIPYRKTTKKQKMVSHFTFSFHFRFRRTQLVLE